MIKDLFYEIMMRFTLRGPGVREGEPERNQDGRHQHVGESLAAGVRPGHVQWLVAVIIIVLKQQGNLEEQRNQKLNHRIGLNNNKCRMLGICNEKLLKSFIPMLSERRPDFDPRVGKGVDSPSWRFQRTTWALLDIVPLAN